MLLQETKNQSENLFQGKVIYYSGSIRGHDADKELAYRIVAFMQENGANVLDPHVAARNAEERSRLFYETSGINIAAIKSRTKRAMVARKQDLEWVDKASHLVALVTDPSLGVGIEIEHTITKPRLGLNKTPMLFLVSEEIYKQDKFSNMILGINPREADYAVGVYKTEEDIQWMITEFLTSH